MVGCETLGSSSAPQVPPYDVWRDETGLRATQTRTEPPNTGVKATEGDGSSSITTFVDYLCPTPLCGRLDQHLSGGRRFALTVISSPTAADVCTNFWMLERNYDVDGPDAPYLVEGIGTSRAPDILDPSVIDQGRRRSADLHR